jgi:ribonuclease HI
MDCFSERVTFFKKPQGMKPEDWMDTLDKAVDKACQLTDHMSVFSDASSTKKDCLQAASAAFIECRGSDLVRIKRPTGRATAPDAELFAIRFGLLRCLRLEEVETILVFTDSVASARAVVDPSTHLGQSHSLVVIWALIPWLEADPLRKVQFWYVPSQARWDNHGEVHKYITSTTGKVAVTPATRATLNFCREKSSVQNLDHWDNMFNDPKYCGSNFLHLWGKEGKMPQPSSHKGGKWLQAFGSDVRLCARVSRAILNHAPIGDYRQHFHVGDRNYRCSCRKITLLRDMRVLETRHHLLTNCKHVSYPEYGRWGVLPGYWRPPC